MFEIEVVCGVLSHGKFQLFQFRQFPWFLNVVIALGGERKCRRRGVRGHVGGDQPLRFGQERQGRVRGIERPASSVASSSDLDFNSIEREARRAMFDPGHLWKQHGVVLRQQILARPFPGYACAFGALEGLG